MSSAFKIQNDGPILGSPEMGCGQMLGLEKLERSSGLCGAAGRPEVGLISAGYPSLTTGP